MKRTPYLWRSFFLITGLLICCRVSGQSAQFEIGTSINPIGSGARALGFGNAFVAVADDATAASWNPAGLLQLESPEISFAYEAMWTNSDLVSKSNSEASGDNDVDLEDLNYASIVIPFFFHTNMVFSLNYLKLYRFDKSLDFPVTFPAPSQNESGQKFNVDFEQEGAFSALIPAYGLDLTDNLSMGISFNIWNNSITGDSQFAKRQQEAGTNFVPSFGDVSHFLTIVDEDFEVEKGYSIVIGGMVRLNANWNIGWVIKPPYDLDIERKTTLINHEISAINGMILDDEIEHSKKNAELEFPLILGTGVAWRPSDPITLSLDITWTQWSEYNFRQEGSDFNPISGQSGDVGKLEDTFTIRTGCEYLFLRDHLIIPFRCGLGYDPAPDVGGKDEFYTLNLGTGIQFGKYNFDIAYEFRWSHDVNKDLFQGLNATEDIRQHRVLASLIYYF